MAPQPRKHLRQGPKDLQRGVTPDHHVDVAEAVDQPGRAAAAPFERRGHALSLFGKEPREFRRAAPGAGDIEELVAQPVQEGQGQAEVAAHVLIVDVDTAAVVVDETLVLDTARGVREEVQVGVSEEARQVGVCRVAEVDVTK